MATVIAVLAVVALAAFMAGEKHGIRVERNRTDRQQPTPNGPGHLPSATLRRIK